MCARGRPSSSSTCHRIPQSSTTHFVYRTWTSSTMTRTDLVVLQSPRCSPPLPQEWHDRAKHLGIWDVEFEDVLRDIPETDRKPPKDSPLYKGQRWRFKRSPIKKCARCLPGNRTRLREKNDSDNDDKDDPLSPSASQSLRPSTRKPPPTNTATRSAQHGGQSRGRGGKPRGQKHKGTPISIQDRPFYTQSVCQSWRAVEEHHLSRLQHEHQVYNQLRSIQGKHVPVDWNKLAARAGFEDGAMAKAHYEPLLHRDHGHSHGSDTPRKRQSPHNRNY
ncbi:hypothetical protein F5B18DRAFT_47945 [Nemania serpens]|nr:hypothetical protein F5B18DRAFT_47945 [Nemania serpens]